MTKKRRATLRLVAGEVEDPNEDVEDVGPRLAPNTSFLGRLVRGVATGNQRRTDATTSNAANLSIGATGAASLRLQLQRTRLAHFQTLRRVVLSSAEQQRLTLCTALLTEVAKGFGFRLTVRQPDGQDVSAREALLAVAHLRPQAGTQPRQEAGGAQDGDGADAAAAAGEAQGDAAGDAGAGAAGEDDTDGGSGGSREAAAPDPLDALAPLNVELGLAKGLERGEAVPLPGRAQESLKSLVGAGLATRLARSPSGLRPVRPGGLTALLSGRLMSAALCSMGLGPSTKTMAAAQAVQAAKRRVLMRAASNAAADEVAAAAVTPAAAGAPDSGAVAPDADGTVSEAAPSCGDATAAAAASGGGSRRIVWNPDKLPKPAAAAIGPPPLKRARPSAAATAAVVIPHGADDGGGSGREEAFPATSAAAAGIGATGDAAVEGDGGEVTEASDGARTGGSSKEEGAAGEGDGEVAEVEPGEKRQGGTAEGRKGQKGAVPPAGPVVIDVTGGEGVGTDAEEVPPAISGQQGAVEVDMAEPGSRPKRTRTDAGSRGATTAAKDQKGAGRSGRLLGAALAAGAARSRSTAPAGDASSGAGGGGGGGSGTTWMGGAVVVADAAPTAKAAPGGADGDDPRKNPSGLTAPLGTCQGDVTAAGAAGSGRWGAASRAAADPVGSGASGKAASMGGLGNSAGKLFGAAVRQLQRRSHG